MTLKVRPDFYYIESDGQVYLIQKKGLWRFPSTVREVPCKFEAVFLMPLKGGKVLFAKPILDAHPAHWFHKDTLIGRSDVDPLVQEAVNRSLPRLAAKVAIVEKGRVLMVLASRGLTQGVWNLPGGFVGYGEHPAESACREVREELGIRVKLVRLVGTYAQTFPQTGGYMVSFVYVGKRGAGKITPLAGEIETFMWMPVREALRQTANPFARAGLRDYLKHVHGKIALSIPSKKAR